MDKKVLVGLELNRENFEFLKMILNELSDEMTMSSLVNWIIEDYKGYIEKKIKEMPIK